MLVNSGCVSGVLEADHVGFVRLALEVPDSGVVYHWFVFIHMMRYETRR